MRKRDITSLTVLLALIYLFMIGYVRLGPTGKPKGGQQAGEQQRTRGNARGAAAGSAALAANVAPAAASPSAAPVVVEEPLPQTIASTVAEGCSKDFVKRIVRPQTSDVLFLTITGSNHHDNKLRWFMDAWGHTVEHMVVFSDDEGSTPEFGPIVKLDGTRATHRGSQAKWYLAIQHICSKPDLLEHPWYMFVDDDTYVYPHRVATILQSMLPSRRAYIGKGLGGTPQGHDLSYASGGSGWIVSNGAMKDILCKNVERLLKSPPHDYSDVAMGIIFFDSGVHLTHIDGLYPGKPVVDAEQHVIWYDPTPTNYKIDEQRTLVPRPLSYHYNSQKEFAILTRDMRLDVCKEFTRYTGIKLEVPAEEAAA